MQLMEEEALKFFSEYYNGEHHIPGLPLKRFGSGYCVSQTGSLATYDFDQLTRLVFMAHRDRIRVEVCPSSPGRLKIAIFKRQKEGRMYERHPSLTEVIVDFLGLEQPNFTDEEIKNAMKKQNQA